MEKVTYVKGQYSQIKLYDGSRIFVGTLPEFVRVKKLILGIIPTKTIWEFKFPFYIRTVGGAWNLAEEILDKVLISIKNCEKLTEVKETLENQTKQLLSEYVKDNEERAYSIGIEKLGSFAAKKYLGHSQKLKDAISMPTDVMSIVGDYGKTLEDLHANEDKRLLHPISGLPHSKEQIEKALKAALKIAKDSALVNHLKIALITLEDFVPDNEVPQNIEDNLRAWAEKHKITH
ncbi:MAG: hypothetical protein HYW65_04120 [Candidatus Liptonbacteria bacterium]|nr:hypothetical protein [Candidatus Liptonbacteria bacterium]